MSIDEQHLRELEAIANSLPADPFGMGRLRLLLGTLPSPTQPEVKSAREGLPDQAPGGSGIGQALSLTSNALPGGESGAVIGVAPELFYGQSNLVPNPALEGIVDALGIATTTTPTMVDWHGFYVLNSGSITSIEQFVGAIHGEESTAFSSGMPSWIINSDGTNAYDLDLYFEHPNSVLLQDMPVIGHLVGAFRVWNIIAASAMTTLEATVQIFDVTDAQVIAESEPLNIKTADSYTTRINTFIAATDVDPSHPVRLILHFHAVKPAGTGFDPFVMWGEPILAFSSTQSPPPFAPNTARWEPRSLSFKVPGDAVHSLLIGDVENVDPPTIRFGPGSAAIDVVIERTGTEELTLKDGSTGLAKLIVGALRVGLANKLIQTGSGDLVFAAGATQTEAVNFGTTFDNTPVVWCWRTSGTGTQPKIHIWAQSVTTSGFTAAGATGDGSVSSATINYAWVALDPTLLA